ncbi:glycerol-3-phosphate ABC transporter ATP-binding protein [PVC group bacterium (ex Bugula neritina AB1)]|nr:glycerol-3-phosphate ABC transporter ATP-binding protein [PVC group bacterium (ex Bugula neritina AB1)]
MARVLLKNVHKFYDHFHAVKNVNLEVKDGEFVVFVGPSGCGKSTSLRMIAGLEDISSGEIFIGDKLVNDIPPKNRDIAMVFQNYALYPHMTVFNNMAFGLKLRKYSKAEIIHRVEEAAKILNITDLLHRKPRQLSGGQRQRVAVGRAIVRKPKVFLFDEPLSNLDAKMRTEMRSELSKLHEKLKATMIYVTHDQAEAMTMGDRIVVMKDGSVQQIDPPIPLYENPANKFIGSFIGTPPMNFVKGLISEDEHGLYFQGIESQFKIYTAKDMDTRLKPYINKRVIFGFRPEDVYDKFFVTDNPTKNIFKARVDMVEPMGSETFVYLKVLGEIVIAKLKLSHHISVHQEIELVVDMNKVHFFDIDSENMIV